MYMYRYGFDWTYLLVLIGIGLTLLASGYLKSTMAKYSRVASVSGLTGAEAARRILRFNGILDVDVVPIAGNLTDHYNPRNKTLSLSQGVFESTSIAALGVAAHECGHAIQDDKGYLPLRLRSAFVPLANLGSSLAWPVIVAGLLLSRFSFSAIVMQIGISLFLLAVLFQIITLPVELNASRRALVQLEQNSLLLPDEQKRAKRVLRAAAMTYVAAAATGVLQLLRLMILANGRRRH